MMTITISIARTVIATTVTAVIRAATISPIELTTTKPTSNTTREIKIGMQKAEITRMEIKSGTVREKTYKEVKKAGDGRRAETMSTTGRTITGTLWTGDSDLEIDR